MTDTMFDDRAFAAFLFDMDGTLISSIAAAERAWIRWAARHDIDPATFLPSIHGMRAIETMRRVAPPGVDVEAEAAWITQAEIDDVEGIHAIAGAADFLARLPVGTWAIVTSAPRELALRRLGAAGIEPPPIFVTSEDIEHGKPDPACYLLAAERFGISAGDCLVFEDAPAGIEAGEASGAAVLVITATHQHPVETSHPVTTDYLGLDPVAAPGGRLRLARR